MISTIPGNRGLRLARLIILSLIVLISGVYIAGMIVHAQTLQQVCTGSTQECQQKQTQLTPEDLASLQASGLSLSAYAALQVMKLLVFSSIWFGVGGLILVRTPNQWMALVVAFTLIAFPTQVDGLPDTLVAAYPALVLPVHFLSYLANLGLPLFIALFPNGRWTPHWVRWIIVISAVLTLPQYFAPNSLANTGLPAETILFAQLSVSLGAFSLLLFAQAIRYRRFSTPIERLQARWVMLGVGAGISIVVGLVVAWATGVLPNTGWVAKFISQILYQTAVVFIPISVALAITRYHLFDIDFIIRRTLVYGALTALLALAYFGGVTVLQGIFTAASGQSSPLAVVLSTLGIALLVNPLRKRVQEFIDRRFYRKKYDSEKALAAFAAAARSETDLVQLSERLTGTIQEALQPERVSLWLKPTNARKQRTS